MQQVSQPCTAWFCCLPAPAGQRGARGAGAPAGPLPGRQAVCWGGHSSGTQGLDQIHPVLQLLAGCMAWPGLAWPSPALPASTPAAAPHPAGRPHCTAKSDGTLLDENPGPHPSQTITCASCNALAAQTEPERRHACSHPCGHHRRGGPASAAQPCQPAAEEEAVCEGGGQEGGA